jgi:hypothetical protein
MNTLSGAEVQYLINMIVMKLKLEIQKNFDFQQSFVRF